MPSKEEEVDEPQQQQQQSFDDDAGAIMSLFPDMPDVLEFESWWTERGGVKRYILICYFPVDCRFQVLVDDSKVPLPIRVMDHKGRVLRAWDLHIGAVIDIFGRSTTLMAATMQTMKWLDDTARRLWKLKVHLEAKVNKFRGKPAVALDYGMFKKLDTTKGALGGIINLGKVARCVHDLERELGQYQ